MSARSATEERSEQATDPTAIRPFHVKVPETAVADLKRRIAATRWPTKELVTDRSQGGFSRRSKSSPATGRPSTDWRKAEARLNAHPQFVTKIDGVDIHFHPRQVASF